MQIELKSIQHDIGLTFLYVTHDQEEALTMSDRIGVMNAGRIEHIGTPAEVYEHPANAFVAQFIGTPPMNRLPATVTDGALRTTSFTLPLRTPLADGRRVIVGIRPEHFTIGGTIQATVDLVEPIGHESIVYASAGSEKLVAIFDPHDAPHTGDTIALGIDANRIHLFDAESESAIS